MELLWELQISISRRLLLWSVISVLTGIALILLGNSFWQGFGIQATAWGIIDAAIALAGGRRALRKRAISHSSDQISREAHKLRRILWVNTGLDVLYIIGGVILAYVHGSIFWRGHGWGVVLQGSFLLLFDLIHAQTTPPGAIPDIAQAFQGEEHLPFFWKGGFPAALLVHGFPGTPAEMRPLGESLHKAGWTVKGILLPGFGSQVGNLMDRRYEEWVAAVNEALLELKREHSPVLLIGYSMGGALSIIASTRQPPDGLLMIAPFWWSASPLKRLVLGLLRPFLPRYFRPFKDADFSDPQVRKAVANFLPQADIDDPGLQDDIHQMIVPISIFHQLRNLSKQAYRQAALVNIPLLVLQGRNDELVKPELTQRLLARFPKYQNAFPNAPYYLELDAGHDLIDTGKSAWPALEKAVLDFAESLKSQFGKDNDATENHKAKYSP
jgi:carboxylesterase